MQRKGKLKGVTLRSGERYPKGCSKIKIHNLNERKRGGGGKNYIIYCSSNKMVMRIWIINFLDYCKLIKNYFVNILRVSSFVPKYFVRIKKWLQKLVLKMITILVLFLLK